MVKLPFSVTLRGDCESVVALIKLFQRPQNNSRRGTLRNLRRWAADRIVHVLSFRNMVESSRLPKCTAVSFHHGHHLEIVVICIKIFSACLTTWWTFWCLQWNMPRQMGRDKANNYRVEIETEERVMGERFPCRNGKIDRKQKDIKHFHCSQKKINDFSNESARIFQLNTNMNTAI